MTVRAARGPALGLGALTALALAAGVGTAAAQPTPRTYFVRVSAGAASQSLRDWKDYVAFQRETLQGNGPPIDWKNVGNAFVPGLEFGYMMNPTVSLGMSLSYQRGTADNQIVGSNASLADKIEASVVALTATATAWPATAPGVFVGVNAGLGMGRAKETLHYRDFFTFSNDADQFGNWTGSGFIGGVFAGYQESFSATESVFVRSWYQVANLGVFDGRVYDPQQGTFPGPPGDGTKDFKTDFTGFGVAIGLGYEFGGSD